MSRSHLPSTLLKYTQNPSDISHLVADVNYTKIHYKNGKSILISYTIKKFEALLSSNPSFIRIHRSVIVNKSFVNKILDNCVSLQSGELFPISRRKLIDLMNFPE